MMQVVCKIVIQIHVSPFYILLMHVRHDASLVSVWQRLLACSVQFRCDFHLQTTAVNNVYTAPIVN